MAEGRSRAGWRLAIFGILAAWAAGGCEELSLKPAEPSAERHYAESLFPPAASLPGVWRETGRAVVGRPPAGSVDRTGLPEPRPAWLAEDPSAAVAAGGLRAWGRIVYARGEEGVGAPGDPQTPAIPATAPVLTLTYLYRDCPIQPLFDSAAPPAPPSGGKAAGPVPEWERGGDGVALGRIWPSAPQTANAPTAPAADGGSTEQTTADVTAADGAEGAVAAKTRLAYLAASGVLVEARGEGRLSEDEFNAALEAARGRLARAAARERKLREELARRRQERAEKVTLEPQSDSGYDIYWKMLDIGSGTLVRKRF